MQPIVCVNVSDGASEIHCPLNEIFARLLWVLLNITSELAEQLVHKANWRSDSCSSFVDELKVLAEAEKSEDVWVLGNARQCEPFVHDVLRNRIVFGASHDDFAKDTVDSALTHQQKRRVS